MDALRQLVGGLLLAVGSLIALLCGLCTGYFGIESLSLLLHGNRVDAAPILAAGVVATLIGVGLAALGLSMLRDPAPPSPEP